MCRYPIQRETGTYRQTELPDCQINYYLLIDRLMRDYVLDPLAPLLCISGTLMIVNSINFTIRLANSATEYYLAALHPN